jgi:hypothetical protein
MQHVRFSRPVLEMMAEPGVVTICWRNVDRIAANVAIRRILGYHDLRPRVAEPLVCRSRPRDGLPVYVNQTGTVMAVSPHDPWYIEYAPDGGDESFWLHIQLEDHPEDSEACSEFDWQSIPFRFGYAVTCYTAQGSEYPRVVVSNDTQGITAVAGHVQARQHLYTAVTRASEQCVLVEGLRANSVQMLSERIAGGL